MKKYSLQTLICPLLFSLIYVNSCIGQVKTNLPKDSVSEPNAITDGQPKIIKTQGTGLGANVHCGLQDKAGNIWFGTTGEGIYCYNGKSFTNFTMKDGLSSNDVWCVYEDKTGYIWFGTNDGVCRYDGKSFTSIPITMTNGSNFYPNNATSKKNAVWSILQDKTGEFWFGTSDGVYRYDGESFTQFLFNDGINNGLHLKHIQSIIEDKNGNIWFASWNQEGVCRFDGKNLTSFKPNDDGMVHSILEDRNGNIWFGTRNHGACHYDGRTFSNFSDIELFSSNCVYSMAEDKAGNIWFGTESGGVWCYNPSATPMTGSKNFTNFTIKDGLSHNSVFSVTIDKSGKLWFGTRGIGLCSYDGKIFTKFSE